MKSRTKPQPAPKFTSHTWSYFEEASTYGEDKTWFEKNQTRYQTHVRAPFEHLVGQISHQLSGDLPRIRISPKSITRPLRQARNASDGKMVKDFSFVTLSEKKVSLFEWNPGIHIQIGAGKQDNQLGMGMYMVSSRQLKHIREAFVDDFETLDKILRQKKLQASWGGLAGEKFVRFPRGYDETHPSSKYLWYRKVYLHKTFTRQEVKKATFFNQVVQDIKVALPFLSWIRNQVGVFPLHKLKKKRVPLEIERHF